MSGRRAQAPGVQRERRQIAAPKLLDDWTNHAAHFARVMPTDYKAVLDAQKERDLAGANAAA